MTISQIIKANDIISLKEEIKNSNLCLPFLAEAAYTAIINCRYECFYIIHEKANEAQEDLDYNKHYLIEILYASSKYNKINILKFLFNEPNFYIEKHLIQQLLMASCEHFRITKLLVGKFTFEKESIYKFLREILSRSHRTTEKIATKKINYLFNLFPFEAKDFLDYLNEKQLFHYIKFNDLLGYDSFNFLTFIKKYDKKNVFLKNIKLWDNELDERAKSQYEAYYIKNKLTNF